MFKYLPLDVYVKLRDVIDNGAFLDLDVADKVAAGIKQWALEMGATHCTHWFQPLTEGTAEKHDAFLEHDFKGGMIEDLDKIRQHIDIPYVFCTVAVDYNATDCNLVAIDDEKESYKIVDYLIKKGHRKIAIICGQKGDFAVGRLRLKGYKLALEANGIEYNPGLVAYQRDGLPDYSLANGYAAMKDLLGSGEEFTAVYVISDLMAFGAYKAIYDAGKKIPDDYSIVGFDGIEMTKYMYPALTTVRQPVEEMITCAVGLLEKAINGEDTGRQIFFAGELMEQDSVKDITH